MGDLLTGFTSIWGWAGGGAWGAEPPWERGRSWKASPGAGEPPQAAALQGEMFHPALAFTPPKAGKGVCSTRSQYLYRGFLFFSLSV